MSDLIPIKIVMRNNKVTQWQVAEYLGISEVTLCRKLRHEPDPEFRKKILEAIEHIKS